MKKILLILTLLVLVLSCGKKENKLVIGVSPVPHKEIVEVIKDDLKEKEGIDLEIVSFDDYVQPNLGLKDKSLDVNFFQHVPYMENFNKQYNMDMVSVGKVHLEPIKVYSKNIKSLDDLKDGDTILIPNDPSNQGRSLILLHHAGILKIKDVSKLDSSVSDIVENPKNLKLVPMSTEQIAPRLVEVAAGIINTNIAITAGLNVKDAIYTEGVESPYVNVVSVLKGRENDKNIKTLVKYLQSEKVRKFIEDNYNGEVVAEF